MASHEAVTRSYVVQLTFHAVGCTARQEPEVTVWVAARGKLDAIHKAWQECDLHLTEEPERREWFSDVTIHRIECELRWAAEPGPLQIWIAETIPVGDSKYRRLQKLLVT